MGHLIKGGEKSCQDMSLASPKKRIRRCSKMLRLILMASIRNTIVSTAEFSALFYLDLFLRGTTLNKILPAVWQ